MNGHHQKHFRTGQKKSDFDKDPVLRSNGITIKKSGIKLNITKIDLNWAIKIIKIINNITIENIF